MESLEEARKKIDSIDDQMAALFKQRMDVAKEIGDYKQRNGLQVLNRTREREILNRMASAVGPELEGYSKVFYSTLFDLSRSRQRRLMKTESELAQNIQNALKNTPQLFPAKVIAACQGVEGAYSQIACDKIFAIPNIIYFRTFEGVFQAVQNNLCEYGILPIENSTAGSVNQVYDMMQRFQFYIVRSIKLRIEHKLLAANGVKLSDIKEIFSHQQAIDQCSAFLKQHSNIKVTICENTAMAAKALMESGRRDAAAISSRDCAELYGLHILDETVQNSDNNYTRFICISRRLEIYPGANKSSLMMALPHKPGSLYNVIARFAAAGMNLTKLESRPIVGKDFEFRFYFDVEGSIYDPNVVRLFSELDDDLDQFTYLGSYTEIA